MPSFDSDRDRRGGGIDASPAVPAKPHFSPGVCVGLAHDHGNRPPDWCLLPGKPVTTRAGTPAARIRNTKLEAKCSQNPCFVSNRNSSTEFRPSAGGCKRVLESGCRGRTRWRGVRSRNCRRATPRHSLASASERGLTPRGSLSASARSSGLPPLVAWNWGKRAASRNRIRLRNRRQGDHEVFGGETRGLRDARRHLQREHQLRLCGSRVIS